MKKLATIIIALAVTFTFVPMMTADQVQAAAKPAKVKITKAVKTNQMVDLVWKKAKRAKKYQIFMKKGKAKWKVVKTVNAKTLKFKKNGLAWNTKYAFKVRAINGKKKGAFSKTYVGKIRKKTTLQKVMTKAQKTNLNKKIQDMVKNDEYLGKGSMVVKGNCIVMTLDYIFTEGEFIYLTGSGGSALKAELDKTYKKAATKKQMHAAIVKDQNIAGIVGINYKLVIRFSDGVEIASYIFK